MPDTRFKPRIRYRTVATPANTIVGNASQRDPRGFEQGFDPRFQPDEAIQQASRDRAEQGIVPWDEIISRLYARNLPPQLVQGSFPAFITAVGAPVQLIFKNPRRQSFIIGNFTSAAEIVFSYGQPLNMGAGLYAGIPIDATDYYAESNGSISIDDIWVTCNAAGAAYPFPVIGYEGTLSISGNQR